MNLLAPAALGLGLLAVPIVAMYILKMRRPPRQVPSAFLWEQVLDDAQANAPWQRLRRNILLLLQLLALAALVLALARPYTLRAAVAQGDVVAVLDASYLMRAADVAPSRFAEAKRRVGALVDGLGPDRAMSIVLMARRPRVLIAQSADRSALHAALDAASPTYETPDPPAALGVAAALARGGRGSSIFVYLAAGDPAVSVPESLRGVTTVTTLPGSPALRDLAVATLAASRAPDGTVTVLARVANDGARVAAADLRLDMTTDSGPNPSWRQVDLRPVSLAPGGSTPPLYRTPLPAATVAVRAHLVGGDDLEVDDWAWAAVPVAAGRRVLLDAPAPGDIYLSGALGILPGVRLDEITPDAYTPARARCADAVVFEETLPVTLPAAPIVAVHPPIKAVPSLGLTAEGAITAAGLQAGDDPYRLLRDAPIGGVALGGASGLAVPPWGYAVLRTNGRPVLVAGQQGARREAVLSFAPYNSTWGGSIGFPIFVRNLLDWLAPPVAGPAGVYRPGDAVPLPAPPCARDTTVTGPSGATVAIGAPGTDTAANTTNSGAAGAAAPLFTDTSAPGLYSVAQTTPGGARRAIFAVNIFPLPSASNTGTSSGAGAGAGGRAPASAKGAQVPVEWAPLAAALALLALSYEWFVAARRR